MIAFIKPPKPNMDLFNKYFSTSIEKNHYTNFGVNHEILKNKLSDIVGTDKIVLTANATLALDGLHNILSTKCYMAYLPSFTFPATNQGCKVSFTLSKTIGDGNNIGRATWDKSGTWARSKRSYTITVNPFGCLNPPLCEKPHSAYWIVDNAAGILSQTKSWFNAGADAVIYSLHATKILSACEGGLVIFNNQKLYEEYSEYINFSFKTLSDGSRTSGSQGSNHKMSELSAAWCLMNLDTYEKEIASRACTAASYRGFCESNNIPYIHSLQAFWLLGKEPTTKIQKFASENDIDIRPYYQKLFYCNETCLVTSTFNQKGFCIPTRSTLTDGEIKNILNMLKEAKEMKLI